MDKTSIRKTDRKKVSKCANPDRQKDGEKKREGEKRLRREGIGEIGSTRGEG